MEHKNVTRHPLISTTIIIIVAILGSAVFLLTRKDNSRALQVKKKPEPQLILAAKAPITTTAHPERQNISTSKEDVLSTIDLSHIEDNVISEISKAFPEDPVVFQWQLMPLISFSSLEEIKSFVADIPVGYSSPLTEVQEESLRETAVETLHSIFVNSPEVYLNSAKRRGEEITDRKAIWAKNILQKNNLLEENSDELSNEDTVKLYWNSFCTQSAWAAASPDKAEFMLFNVTCDPSEAKPIMVERLIASLPKHEEELKGINGYKRFATPKRGIEQTLDKSNKLICANLLIFIKQQGRLNLTLPYVIQFWLDPFTNIWHPHKMVCGNYGRTDLIIF